jgi:hypothetical protein
LAGKTVDLSDYEGGAMPEENDQIPHEDDEQRGDPAVTEPVIHAEDDADPTTGAPPTKEQDDALKVDADNFSAALAAYLKDPVIPTSVVIEPSVTPKPKTFPRRVWHKKGQYGARLVASQVEIRALGYEWTDEAPKQT